MYLALDVIRIVGSWAPARGYGRIGRPLLARLWHFTADRWPMRLRFCDRSQRSSWSMLALIDPRGCFLDKGR